MFALRSSDRSAEAVRPADETVIGILAGVNRVLPLNHRLWPLLSRAFPDSPYVALQFWDQSIVFAREHLTKFSSRAILHRPVCSHPEVPRAEALLQMYLRSADFDRSSVCADIGAAVGVMTGWMRRSLPGSQRIVAFEPSPQARECWILSKARNAWDHVELRACALGEAVETRTLVLGGNSYIESAGREPTPGRSAIDVATSTLDIEFDALKLGFVKLDVEGFELKILKGGRSVLKRDRPYLWLETHPNFLPNHGDSMEEVVALLQGLDYVLDFFCYTPNTSSRLIDRLGAYYRFPPAEQRAGAWTEMARSYAAGPMPDQVFISARPR